MVEFNRDAIRTVIKSPLTVGIAWFVCDLILDWTKRPLKINLAMSLMDAVIATLIYAAIDKVFSLWTKSAEESHVQSRQVRLKQPGAKK